MAARPLQKYILMEEKTMKIKKLVALGLTGVTALSMTAPAFAANGKVTKITTTYQDVPINVIVPTTGTAYINPYKLPIDVTTTDPDTGESKTITSISGEQITTMPMAMVNTGTVKLKVFADVKVSQKSGGAIKFVSTAPTASTTGKEVMLKLQAKASALTEADGGFTAADPDSGVAASVNMEKLAEEVAPTAFWTSGAKAVTIAPADDAGTSATGESGTATLVELAAIDDDKKVPAGGIAAIRLSGTVAPKPEKEWTKTDTFDTVVTFTFEPSTTTSSGGSGGAGS